MIKRLAANRTHRRLMETAARISHLLVTCHPDVSARLSLAALGRGRDEWGGFTDRVTTNADSTVTVEVSGVHLANALDALLRQSRGLDWADTVDQAIGATLYAVLAGVVNDVDPALTPSGGPRSIRIDSAYRVHDYSTVKGI
ncbi:hypothetical protein [Kitasatospora sp. A2-31]|uniref:hypothetical protein n=1 Tax=Kitasatospora sp. A2-31 TaxID=2916414 RepID=UPI001EEB8B4D|nr:hypothetical protein [Kitasatospora sp. A2-31]MCG6496642.1 hypothetical protein [Kitasatospora sp. A2-31]